MDFTMTLSDSDADASDDSGDESSNEFGSGFAFDGAAPTLSATAGLKKGRHSRPVQNMHPTASYQSSIDEKIRKLRNKKQKKHASREAKGEDVDEEEVDKEEADEEEADGSGSESEAEPTASESPKAKKKRKASDDAKEAESQREAARKRRKPNRPNTAGNEHNVQFSELKLSRPLLKAVAEMGFTTPTSVQAAAIPIALAGADLLVSAVTGSGKTAAFMLPILERLLHRPKQTRQTRVLVLTPTRELAAQILAMSQRLAQFTDVEMCFVVGGLAMKPQETALRARPDIVIATTGRLIDHMRNSPSVHLEDIEILVLDEADRLLEESFTDEIFEIVRMCPRGRQTMLFSATMSSEVSKLAKLSLNDPKKVAVDDLYELASGLQQEFVRIREKHNDNTDKTREAIVLSLCQNSFKEKTIIFLKSKTFAHRMKIIFGLLELKAAELHGNLTQTQRLDALEKFRTGEVNFLLCTDLASRGLDIKGVETVISSHLPRQVRTYVHRVGRTARAGLSGRSVTLVGDNERKILKQIMKSSREHASARHSVVNRREVDAENIRRAKERIAALDVDVREIFSLEAEEKRLRIAEMEANKLQNVMKYQDEILSRPQRSWFQSQKEKELAKTRTADDASSATQKASSNTVTDADTDKKEKREKKKKKDPLKGLSRKKKRRKIFLMEEQKEREQAAREAAVDGAAVGFTFEESQRRMARQVKRKAKAVNYKIGGEFTQPQKQQATKKKKKQKQQEEAPPEEEKKKSRAKVRYAPTQRKSRKNDADAATEFAAKQKTKAKTKLKTKKRYRKRH